MDFVYSLDLLGTFAFAVSGTLAGTNKKFDIFGAPVIGFVTAIGGGTLRDVLVGNTPVRWMLDTNYLVAIAVGIVCGYLFRPWIERMAKTMFLFDTAGIGLFAIGGLQTTLEMGLSAGVGVMMGTVSAVFGGVLRDVLCNEVPLIFRKEIYATACMAGCIGYIALNETALPTEAVTILSISIVIMIRLVAVWKRVHQ